MIQYINTKRLENIPFDQYLKIGGYSHSFLKNQKNGISEYFNVTDKVRLGSLVDALLTQDDRFDFTDPLANKAILIAREIKNAFGGMIELFKPQISYTSTLKLGNFHLDVTGRLDWELPKQAVIDLKVTDAKSDKQYANIIEHMGYKNQVWNYSKMAGVKKAFILPFSVPLNKCLSIISVPIEDRNEFWEDNVLKFGSVVND